MTVYPGSLDTDLELAPTADNVSEISADNINSIRNAVLAIERALGIDPQGTKTSLASRINICVNEDGTLKTSALQSAGLVALPITNSMVGSTAGIKEHKLDLDYATASLNSRISSLSSDMSAFMSSLNSSNGIINNHILGTGSYHDGYAIKINAGETKYGVAGLEATTVGDALSELGAYLLSGNGSTIEPHIDTGIPTTFKHNANKISVDGSDFNYIDRTVTSVQAALDSLDESSGGANVEHVDTLHSNGILKEIKSGTYYNDNRILLSSTSGASYTEGTGVVTIPGVTSFSTLNVREGDILRIHAATGIADSGSYQIRAIGPLLAGQTIGGLPALDDNQIAVFHTFMESRSSGDSVVVSLYRPATESSELAPLACAVRNNETLVDTISVLPPTAARVVSIGFNGDVINGDGYDLGIRAGVGSGQVRYLTIPNLNLERLNSNQADPVTAKSVAERINAYVSDPTLGYHFPITAYSVGNEIIIAHNWFGDDNYTIEIDASDGYGDSVYAMGLDGYGADVVGDTILGNSGNKFIVDGVAVEKVYNAFDGYANISSDSSTFVLWDNNGNLANPLRYGIGAGSIMHVSGHSLVDQNGSYTLSSANSAGVSVFADEAIVAPFDPTTFNVKFYDTGVALNSLQSVPTDRGLIQLYIDSDGKTMTHQRLLYSENLSSTVEIVNVSTGFAAGECSLYVTESDNYYTFNIVDGSLYGESVVVHESFRGTFKLYHYDGIHYFKIKVSGALYGSTETILVNDSLPEDGALLLCTAHFDSSLSINNIIDERQFGNLGADQIRDSFIEVYAQYPVKELRADGVVRGFGLLDAIYSDSQTNTQAVPIRGGVAYVDGVRVAVESQKVVVPTYDCEGSMIKSGKRVMAINSYGSIQVLNETMGEVVADGYVANEAYGRSLPLYSITISDGEIYDVIDVRKFINNIDDKLELIVDETNNVVGNFRTLEGALYYAQKYPSYEKLTIKVINKIYLQSAIIIPEGISIIGGAPFGGSSKHQIINYSVLSSNLITLSGNNRIENVEIISPSAALRGALVFINGSNINVEKCQFRFGSEITTNSGDYAIEISNACRKNVRVINNKIDNVYSGIIGNYGVDNLEIGNNVIENVSGTGGNAYGVKIGTASRITKNINVYNNTIKVPSIVSATDMRGISVSVGYNVDVLRIDQNSIIHEAQNTMTNGIRVDTLDGYTGVADQVYISSNVIDGIMLDDNNVYGVYIANSNNLLIEKNIITNVGVYDALRENVALIEVTSTSGQIEIFNNILTDSNATRGIEIGSQSRSAKVNIRGNSIVDIGVDAHYVRGMSSNSSIVNNFMSGPGTIGVRWSGNDAKISENHMTRINDGSVTDYAFSSYAIYAPASDVDISDNTITGMIYSSGAIGISNGGAARNRLKISGNTITGSFLQQGIELYGQDHIISNNKIYNEEDALGGLTTDCLSLNAVSNSLIMGNTFGGIINTAISSGGTAVDKLTIVNNDVSAITIAAGSVNLLGTTTNCLVMGNRLPDGSGTNTIGANPSFGSYNTNIIGINYGISDTRSLHAAEGISGVDSSGAADYSEYPHWILKDGNDYWEPGSLQSSDDRLLYFPISCLPNGAKLDSVQIQGEMPAAGGGNLTARLYKRSVRESGLTQTAISNNTTISATAEFRNDTATGTVAVTTSGGEVINYYESTYYLEIIHSQALPLNPEDVRIYGITINYTY